MSIVNPFISINKTVEINGDKVVVNKENIYYYFKKLYIIVPIVKIEGILNETITSEMLETIVSKCLVLETNLNPLKNKLFYSQATIWSREELQKFNLGSNEIVSDNVLVLPLLSYTYDKIKPYLDLYSNQQWLEKMMVQAFFSDLYCVKKNTSEMETVLNATPNHYWSKHYNCEINHTKRFKSRDFKWTLLRSIDNPNIIKTVQQLEKYKLKDDNYLHIIFGTAGNLEERLGKLSWKLYKLPHDKTNLTNEHINELFNSINDEKVKYKLICNLLVSPEYSHLIINNKYMIEKMNAIMERVEPFYKYLLFYAYMGMYLKEIIMKGNLKITDNCVLTIDAANKLPNFQYDTKNPMSHPALSAGCLINNELLNKKNFYGLPYTSRTTKETISTFEEFKENMNTFITGTSKTDIFEGIDWSNIGVTGSIMAACVPKSNPLLNLFINYPTRDEKYSRFFQEYYANSDVDIICTIWDRFKFYDKVQHFSQTIKENLAKIHGIDTVPVKVNGNKRALIRINLKFIIEHIAPKSKHNINYILTHLDDPEIVELFYQHYLKEVANYYATLLEKVEDKETYKVLYQHVFEPAKADELKIIMVQEFEGRLYSVEREVNNMVCIEEKEDTFNYEKLMNDEKESIIKVSETIKYRIESPFLLHPFEVFQVYNEDPMSTINRFHLGAVRSLYNGSQVYMTISAFMTYQTMHSPDYRILLGKKDPVEILNTYRMRGFGVYLNEEEMAKVVKYSEMIPSWQKLYEVKSKTATTVEKMASVPNITWNLFKPRKVNENDYVNAMPVEFDYATENDFGNFLTMSNNNDGDFITLFKFETINSSGYPQPFKPWLIDAVWDLKKLYKKPEEVKNELPTLRRITPTPVNTIIAPQPHNNEAFDAYETDDSYDSDGSYD